MRHLSKAQMVLHLQKKGLTPAEQSAFTQHLLHCPTCQYDLLQLRTQLKMLKTEPLSNCSRPEDEIIAYLENELNHHQRTAIEEHLAECRDCRELCEWLTLPSNWETEPPSLKISVAVRIRLENTVLSHLKQRIRQRPTRKSLTSVLPEIEKKIFKVALTFRPLLPATIFRAQPINLEHVIEHPGGDLLLSTNLKNMPLVLSSIFEEATFSGKTNNQGEVKFSDLHKDDYTVWVRDYELVAVNLKKMPE